MHPIVIKYNGGKINIEIKQFKQHITLSRSPKVHGKSCIVENTCWNNDMIQTIKPGNCNYYLMSKNKFINIENPQISTEDTTNTLIIQIINASVTIKQQTLNVQLQPTKSTITQQQKLEQQLFKSENTNILQNHIKLKDNITVEI
jgi:hypothetical protein